MNDLFQLSKDKKTILSIKDKTIKEVVIPFGISAIGKRAFMNCKFLQSIIIPNSVTEIGG